MNPLITALNLMFSEKTVAVFVDNKTVRLTAKGHSIEMSHDTFRDLETMTRKLKYLDEKESIINS